jgi:hypothetical protein
MMLSDIVTHIVVKLFLKIRSRRWKHGTVADERNPVHDQLKEGYFPCEGCCQTT